MQLRDHPLMTYNGVRNWPPAWVWRGGDNNKKLRGEIGIIRDVFLSKIEPSTRLFLVVEHESNEYVGCVMFSDEAFCVQVHQLLRDQQGKSMVEVGSLDVSQLL
jgi:hypothetical protein